jgi:uncharacterized damage-inducible protein DinB
MDHGSRRLEEIRTLFEYDRWAMDRALGAMEVLTDEQLGREVGGAFPSVRETTAHVLGAGFVWLSRWKGSVRGTRPEPWVFTDLTSLRTRAGQMAGEIRAYLRDLAPDDLDREIDIVTSGGLADRRPVVETMRHAVNHASYHRGQIADQMRLLGATPASTDLFLFYHLRARGEAGGV